MKVCFLVSELSRSGGVAVVTQHAERLGREHGIEADLVVTSDEGSVAEALATEYDAAISTWWETAALLWRLKARRRIAFLQSAEECFYRGSEAADRLGAALSMRAADEYVVVSSWLAELVRGIRPGAAVTVVPNGIDKQVFDGSRVERDGPLRVLVEGQPSVWLKGVPDALAAVRAADAPIHLTVVSPTVSDGVNADRVLSEIEPEAMARLYGETDLVVKLSRLEGLGLVPLEAFHHGVPCVVTPYGGDTDYVRHGENGFVAGFDDLQVVTRYVERLAGDGDLWRRLSEGALATAAEWPDTASSTELFAQALQASPEREEAGSVAAVLDAWRLAAEQDRGWRSSWQEDALAETRAALEDRIAEIERLNALVDELEHDRLRIATQLEDVQGTRAYRAAVAARSVVNRVRR